jgi:hypothetical protein
MLRARVRADQVIFKWKREVVERRVFKKPPSTEELTRLDPAAVFSCYNQDQPLGCVDFHFLSERLRQSSAVEKLTSLWLDHLFERREVQMV